jgi:hypothetical protein
MDLPEIFPKYSIDIIKEINPNFENVNFFVVAE